MEISSGALGEFEQIEPRAAEGRRVLAEIEDIDRRLARVDELAELRIYSPNDSSWEAGLGADEIRRLVKDTLRRRRQSLASRFNDLFGGKQ